MNDLQFARRAKPPTSRAIWLERLRDWRGGIVVLVVIPALIAIMFSRHYWVMRDLANAPVMTGRAKVVRTIWTHPSDDANDYLVVELDFQGQKIRPDSTSPTLAGHVKPGDAVIIKYRVGRSRQIYVLNAEEISRAPAERLPANPAAR